MKREHGWRLLSYCQKLNVSFWVLAGRTLALALGLAVLAPVVRALELPGPPALIPSSYWDEREPQVVRYLGNNTTSVSESYYLSVIERALTLTEVAYGPYRVDFVQEELTSERKHELLIVGKRVNIDRLIGFPTHKGLRRGLLQIKVPLLMGFMGYRIPLIRREHQYLFEEVNNIADLRHIPMGLGKGWEGNVYKANNFSITEPTTMTSLLKMLTGKRYFYVPLGAVEIEDRYEIDGRLVPELVPEKTLLIHMQLPMYFYVSPREPVLARRLEEGMQLMQLDGSLLDIFKVHFGARLARLGLSGRKLIEVPNPDDDGSVGVVDHRLLQALSRGE
jgi:hypothetical protein